MADIVYKRFKCIDANKLRRFLSHTDWKWERQHPGDVQLGLESSSEVITAWADNELVGMIRCFTDYVWSADIDTLLVHSGYYGNGIGTELLQRMLKILHRVHFVYVAPNDKSVIPFYEKNGFSLAKDGSLLQIENSL